MTYWQRPANMPAGDLAGVSALFGPEHVLSAEGDLCAGQGIGHGRQSYEGGTHHALDAFDTRLARAASAHTHSTASATVLFIFQLPAMIGLRMTMLLLA